MPGRKFSSGSEYRYGFNGQEKSDDVTQGNYTAEYWEYDSRIGRRWNVDPVLNCSESPYATFSDNPILIADPTGDVPGGKRTDKEIVAAYSIVKKHFNPKKNLNDIKFNLQQDALSWYYKEYGNSKDKKATVADFFKFQELVLDLWQDAYSSAGFNHYEQNDKIIQNMSTDAGKALAILSLSFDDRKKMDFFVDILVPSTMEFLEGAALTAGPFGFGESPNQVRKIDLKSASSLFRGIPQQAGKLLGARGEELTELMLRRAYPNATIAKQVMYRIDKYTKTFCDFVVINEGKVVAIWESKVNNAIMSEAQKALYIEAQAGKFTGKAAKAYRLEGKGLPSEALRREIRYNSTSGSGTILRY